MAIPNVTRVRIISLYMDDGYSIKKIRKITGVSEPTISKILKINGITIRKTNYQDLGLDHNNINELYDSGRSTYEIAAMMKCSDESIRKIVGSIRCESERNLRTKSSKGKIGDASRKNWQNAQYREKVKDGKTQEYLDNLHKLGKRNYHLSLGKWIRSDEAKQQISNRVRQLWQNDDYRAKQKVWFQQRAALMASASKKALSSPQKRKQWISNLRQSSAGRQQNNGWISTTQAQLYYILSDSNVEFFEEGPDTRISPFYVVDCVIPKQQRMLKPLIIEVNGEYWHSLSHVVLKDRQKSTYIEKHTGYDLLVIDELEMSNYSQVVAKIREYGIKLETHSFRVKDITIKRISEMETEKFYSIFHYSSKARKGATTFGAFVDDLLMAAISYTYPLRTSSAHRLGCDLKEIMEISRLARRTNIKCTNLASFFIAKTKSLLPKEVKKVLSFSDHTYGHQGTVYKAAGFINDGEVSPDYYYASINGKYHKKTIWDRAKRMKMSETDYVNKHNLVKIPTDPKTRWVLTL